MKKSKDNPIERKIIRAPREICLYNHHASETSKFLNLIEYEVFYNNRYILIDFSLTEKLTAAAALSLATTITLCQNCTSKYFAFKNQVIDFIFPETDRKNNLFISTGLWEIIKPGGIKKLERVWKDKENPFKTGSNPAEQYAELLNWLQYKGIKLPRKLSSAIQEAYLNVRQHAYPETRDWHSFLVGRWWQYAFIREDTKKLVFLLLDRGVGIPYHVNGMKYAFKSDQQKIATAMTRGWSSTNLPGRGRGSGDIQEPVSLSVDNNTLLIMSGKGRYLFKQNHVIELDGLDVNMQGTLIEWAVYLE